MKKLIRWPSLIILAALLIAALVPAISLWHSNGHAVQAAQPPIHDLTFPKVKSKPRPHHLTNGVDRTHLPALSTLANPVQSTGKGAYVDANEQAYASTTIFFDNMEHGTNGWTTVGDNNKTGYYPNGHDFWNLVNNPNSIAVPAAVNPTLVSYPDTAGLLPAAASGTHAWWYGDSPATDTNPSSATATYMGNEYDWPAGPENAGGTSNGPNSASLISPSIDLTGVTNATLTFATWWEIESVNPAHFDMMYVEVSTDGGNTWNSVGVLNPVQNPPGGTDAYPYTDNGIDTPASWQVVRADLTPYIGSHIQLRFRFDTVDSFDNGFRGWLIDNVGVYSASAGTPRVSSVSPTSGVVGTTVTINGSGFGATQQSSSVTFNNITAPVQSWSDTSIVVTVPANAVSGNLTVTVHGMKLATGFSVVASVNALSAVVSVGSSDSFSGQGFNAGEPVNVYIDGVNGTLLTSATTDSNGNLATSSITIAAMPGGKHLVMAIGQTSHIAASTDLVIVPTISTSISSTQVGQYIPVTGTGFSANEGVSFYLDGNILYDVYISSDKQGNISGNVYFDPAFRSLSNGLHTLFAFGQISGLEAQLPLLFTPGITQISSNSGVPGMQVTLYGMSFPANDGVDLYWGSTTGPLIGAVRSDSTGNVQANITVPTGVSAGNYSIVAQSRDIGANVTVPFQIMPPTVQLSTGGIQSGQTISASISGFQANEQLTISWNANGGQQVYTTQAGYQGGAYSSNISFPTAPSGSYIVTVTGATSGLKATAQLNVGPGIVTNPYDALVGSTVTVNGGGFTPNEKVSVYLQQTSNGVVTTTTDASGAFTVPLKVPLTYLGSPVTVYATGAKGENVSTQMYEHEAGFYLQCCQPFGYPAHFTGQYFTPGETVNILWKYQQPGQRKIYSTTADSNGNISFTIMLPSIDTYPNNYSVPVAAHGLTSRLTGVTYAYQQPGFTLTPAQGPAGSKVSISGGNFAASETVTISYNNIKVATAKTMLNGSFAAGFIVPKGALLGRASVVATGNYSENVGVTFIVTPQITISPDTGTSGTPVTVNGSHFTPSTTATIAWYDPSTGNTTYLANPATDSTGAFTTTITAPSGLVSGNIYYVEAFDGPSQTSTEVPFVAQ